MTGAPTAASLQDGTLQSMSRIGLRSRREMQFWQRQSFFGSKKALSASLYFARHSLQPIEFMRRLMLSCILNAEKIESASEMTSASAAASAAPKNSTPYW